MDQERLLPRAVQKSKENIRPEHFVSGVRIICPFCLMLGVVVIFLLCAAMMVSGMFEAHLPLIVGLVLLGAGTALAFAVENHTPLQSQVIAALFSLGGSAVATNAIAGALDIKLTIGTQAAITASGALAVFVVIYFFRARWDR